MTPRRTAALLAALAAAPLAARAEPSPEAPAPELVAEALFLCDTLPPGGRDLNLSVGVAKGEPDEETGETRFEAWPRLQLAMALGERVGLTADVGVTSDGDIVDTPGASLKLLLLAPEPGRTGLSASLDLFGSTHSLDHTEAGVGLGAIRALGRVALRVGASLASGVSDWSPHVHAGASAAMALGSRWRVLAEVVSDVAGGEADLSLGPTVKLALGENTSLMAGALFPVAPEVLAPSFAVQLGWAL
jgi:hypothetical protein